MDWASLWACGPATEVPQLLRTLASSDDREQRKAALRVLTGERLIYQGMSILEVTPYAVPFLIELLSEESVEEKAGILALLGTLAMGSTFLEGSGALDGYDEASAPPDLVAVLVEQLGWVERVYQAVEAGLPVYLRLLAHPEEEVRRFAVGLLSLLPAQAPVILPQLEALLARKEALTVEATAVLSLGTLLQRESPDLERLRAYLRPDTQPLLRCVAALAWVHCAREATPPEVVQALLEAVDAAEAITPLYHDLPQFYLFDAADTVPLEVGRALAQLELPRAIPALVEVLHRMVPEGRVPDGVQAWEILDVVELLLGVVFADPQAVKQWWITLVEQGQLKRASPWSPRTGQSVASSAETHSDDLPAQGGAETLTPKQRTMLTALVDYDPLWTLPPDVLMVPGYGFQRYELPGSREALRALLMQ